jgi:hypothetical protein
VPRTAASVERMNRRRVDWAAGRWTREPATTRLDGDDLVVGASEGSDFWRTTHYGFVHDDGHALLGDWPTDAAVEVTFDASSLTALYDQAGIMLHVGPEQWIKSGLELSDGVLHLGAVVTNGVSDWSLAPVPDWTGQLVTGATRDDPGESCGRRPGRCGAACSNGDERLAHASCRAVHGGRGIRGTPGLRADAR